MTKEMMDLSEIYEPFSLDVRQMYDSVWTQIKVN